MRRRVGTFQVSTAILRDLPLYADAASNIFHRMVVLRAEQDWQRDVINYMASHPDFDEIEHGAVVPEYVAVFHPGEIYPTWSRL